MLRRAPCGAGALLLLFGVGRVVAGCEPFVDRAVPASKERGPAVAEAEPGRGSQRGTPAAEAGAELLEEGRRGEAGAEGAAPSPSGTRAARARARRDDPEQALRGTSWTSCYEGYRAVTTPEPDATRLGLLCGASNGMTGVTRRFEGVVDEGAGDVRHEFRAAEGECYRIMAAAEPAVDDLELEVRDPRGTQLTVANHSTNWALAGRSGPFCAREGGYHAVHVRTHGGRGTYALHVWRLLGLRP